MVACTRNNPAQHILYFIYKSNVCFFFLIEYNNTKHFLDSNRICAATPLGKRRCSSLIRPPGGGISRLISDAVAYFEKNWRGGAFDCQQPASWCNCHSFLLLHYSSVITSLLRSRAALCVWVCVSLLHLQLDAFVTRKPLRRWVK